MTEAELEQWSLLANWHPKRKEWLRVFLGRFVIVPSSRDLVLKWAEVMVAARSTGRRLETADAWIAALFSMTHRLSLITRAITSEFPALRLITEAP